MTSDFNKNCVITGVAGSFCLLCQTRLTKNDLGEHITASEHEDKLKSTAYLEKYKDDFIRKVKMGYYCEICNLLLQTSSKVAIHANDSTHNTNKNYNLLTTADDGVIAFGELFIEKRAWNGLNNDSCYICNVDYCNENDHLNESSHILNLIQGKFELKRGKSVYRKVDGTFLNCVVCNDLISIESKDSHVEDSDHINNYAKCEKNMENRKIQSKQLETTKKSIEPVEIKSTFKENDDKVKKDMKTESDSASPTNCAEKLNDTPNNCDGVLPPNEALNNTLQFAKENHLKYKRNNTYCKVCDVKISSSLLKLKEHVAEQSHKDKVKTFKRIAIKKVPMKDFVIILTTVNNFFYEVTVVNDKFCMKDTSFQTITRNGERIRCQICEVSIKGNEIESHTETLKHKRKLAQTPVVTEFDTEFIREVRSGIYHCGFCNFIEATWEGLKNHLNSIDHKQEKLDARACLNMVLPDIIKEREQSHHLQLLRHIFRNGM